MEMDRVLFEEMKKEVKAEVLAELQKSITKEVPRMEHDQAVLWLLRKKPNWTYDFASKFVQYTMQNS